MAIDDSPLGGLLRQHRLAARLTQEELADRAGISTRTISDVERGLRTRIWECAAEKRDESGEPEAFARRHADHYLAIAEAAELELGRGAQEQWFEILDTEHDNFRAALRWAIERRHLDVALRLTGALWRSWMSRGYQSEGRM